jgi:hypothetical protein
MKLWPLVLLFFSMGVFAQKPPIAIQQNQPHAGMGAGEPQARAWFEERHQANPGLKQVAEGKYLISDDEDAPPQETSSSDTWTLWKSSNGEFEVNGILVSSGESIPYWINLTSRMRPTAFKVFRPDKTCVGCQRTPSKLLCQQTDSEGRVLRTVDDDMSDPAEIFTPITFFWAGLTRNAEFPGGKAANFTLLAEGEETMTFPVSYNPLGASLRLLRRGKYPVPQGEMDAAQFQLTYQDPSSRPSTPPPGSVNAPGSEPPQPYVPMFDLWVSSDGILLSASPPGSQVEYVRLVQFKKLADF